MQPSPIVEKVKRALLCMQRHSWEQGVAAQALLELGDDEVVILMAKEAVLRQGKDGRLAMVGSDTQVTDPGANGEPVLHAARLTGDPALAAAADRMLDYLLHTAPRTADGVLYHVTHAPEIWIDAAYMAPPFLAVAGHPEEAVYQMEGYHQRLWNPARQLYSHIWDENKQAFVRQDCWGVGNGWMAAGMTRVLRALPPNMSAERQRLQSRLRAVIDGCLAHQRTDGLFHDVVDRPDTFVETNLAQMLAYSIYRGLQDSWLESAYRPAADRLRAAVHRKVDEFGLVQDVCGAPGFDRPATAPEGQAFFLLMEAALIDLGES